MYQTSGAPPGNRLTKCMLAGELGPDKTSASDAIIHAYGKAGIGGVLHNKAENFVTIAGGGPMFSRLEDAVSSVGRGRLAAATEDVRASMFLKLLPSFGLLLIVLMLMAIAR